MQRPFSGSPFSDTTKGILQLCAGMLILPILDVFAKLLGGRLDPIEVSLMRFVMQSALMAPFVIYLRLWHIPEGTFWLQAARGVMLAIATVFFFAALQHLPMAEAIAIFFVQPIILTILSVLFLGETIRARRIAAIVFGMVGTMIILQPSLIIFGTAALLPLGSSVSMAVYMVLTRKLAGTVPAYQMQFLVGISSVLVLGFVMIIGAIFDIPGTAFLMPNLQEFGWIIFMGLAATIGHIFIVWAARHAAATVLAPFQYVEIVGATTLGFLVFGDVPALSTIIGVTIIILSGVYLFHRERKATLAETRLRQSTGR
ncbi:MAG: EamA family transporter [Alphaproteobacteria bacterium]